MMNPSSWLRRCRVLARSVLMNKTERRYRELCEQRPQLSDEEFIRAYYAHEVNRAVALRVRRILREQLKFDRIEPSDRPCDILQDIDLSEIIWELAESFRISVNAQEVASLDGSIDSMIRLIDKKVAEEGGRQERHPI